MPFGVLPAMVWLDAGVNVAKTKNAATAGLKRRISSLLLLTRQQKTCCRRIWLRDFVRECDDILLFQAHQRRTQLASLLERETQPQPLDHVVGVGCILGGDPRPIRPLPELRDETVGHVALGESCKSPRHEARHRVPAR